MCERQRRDGRGDNGKEIRKSRSSFSHANERVPIAPLEKPCEQLASFAPPSGVRLLFNPPELRDFGAVRFGNITDLIHCTLCYNHLEKSVTLAAFQRSHWQRRCPLKQTTTSPPRFSSGSAPHVRVPHAYTSKEKVGSRIFCGVSHLC